MKSIEEIYKISNLTAVLAFRAQRVNIVIALLYRIVFIQEISLKATFSYYSFLYISKFSVLNLLHHQ